MVVDDGIPMASLRLPNGLRVYKPLSPFKRHTYLHLQNKTVYEIASELNRLHSLGLAGQLTPADIIGGTFSLSLTSEQ